MTESIQPHVLAILIALFVWLLCDLSEMPWGQLQELLSELIKVQLKYGDGSVKNFYQIKKISHRRTMKRWGKAKSYAAPTLRKSLTKWAGWGLPHILQSPPLTIVSLMLYNCFSRPPRWFCQTETSKCAGRSKTNVLKIERQNVWIWCQYQGHYNWVRRNNNKGHLSRPPLVNNQNCWIYL